MSSVPTVQRLPHHDRQQLCTTRPPYREGRKQTAVKVYTISQESTYLLFLNVPEVGAGEDLRKLCSQFGDIVQFNPLDEYPGEEYTETYLAKFSKIQDARNAKKKMDDVSFYGGILHVCYAPEFETVEETRQKLLDRRRYVEYLVKKENKTKQDTEDIEYKRNNPFVPPRTPNPRQETPSLLEISTVPSKPQTLIWSGKELPITPSEGTRPQIPWQNIHQLTEPKKQTRPEIPDVPKPPTPRFVPRQLAGKPGISFGPVKEWKGKTVAPKFVVHKASEESVEIEENEEDPMQKTSEAIREKLNAVAEPVREVSFKKAKR